MGELALQPSASRVLTMEIFSEADFDSSCEVMEKFVAPTFITADKVFGMLHDPERRAFSDEEISDVLHQAFKRGKR